MKLERATIEGTAEFKKRLMKASALPESAFAILGRTGLAVSGIGFGTYRVDGRNSHMEALRLALLAGCNLIDTSTNYTDGGSEKAVGSLLQALQESRELNRDEIVIVSKVGYIQGQNLEWAKEAEVKGKPYQDVVKYTPDCWHCIHPDFIHEQLTLSLERLKIPALDVYLLHNPEYFLTHLAKRGFQQDADEWRLHFYQRIRAAFNQLEDEVAAGRIASYGVSSNNFPLPESNPTAVSLKRLWDIAGDVAEERAGDRNRHHFSVVQTPFNLLEVGAALEKNNAGHTVIEFAREKNIGVLINRPLNAFKDGRLIRLATATVPETAANIRDENARLVDLEMQFVEKISPQLTAEGIRGKNLFPWGQELSHLDLASLYQDDFDHIEHQIVRNEVRRMFQVVEAHLKDEDRESWALWRSQYWPQVLQFLALMRIEAVRLRQDDLSELISRLDRHIDQSLKDAPLSQKAIAVLRQIDGVSCVLVGMRSKDYVLDAMPTLTWPPFAMPPEALAEISR